ncbi:elongation factor G [Candidatus Aminicenantes bacterium AC-335-A11]|nr:elongation factor G [SCandidatus Aminicenantes bacterium Aminicenantia_JdfR_composite]MCP2597047.1 elongation factor G [Candidatus Aminicenantes bacterium AC-335-G13]MCP2598001.1 elongation factor G [Candidatus Aminicenantes bacterium AC-335-L06]MCP2605653.1 elongation factor G [Candidatus Aminicenantes bacterium AC-335-O07]MCP2606172.1 elongation factor G [Candidatus Aminicenantes bacterium AC-708-I09]MCP2618843.1 elongation factor G [Candidatus Aminicenantes bacterium AC-335-A11]
MRDYQVSEIRNVALVGHGSTGKTSLVSAFLFNTGVTSRLCKVDQGNTVTDYDPEEIERKFSISSAMCFCEWNGYKITFIDTPGYSNFLWDTKASLRGVDSVLILVCGASGVEVGTEKVWEMVEELKHPRIFVINKLDRELADFDRALDSIHQFFGRQAVPIQIPIGKEKDFKGIIDLINFKAYIYEKNESGKFKEEDIPDNLKELAEKRKRELTEMIAENDEELMEKYFEKGDLSSEELKTGLKKAVLNNQIYPIVVCSALLNIGTQPILDNIINFLPSPGERGSVKAKINGKDGEIEPSINKPFSAFVFKTLSDPYAGRISLMRIFSGKVGPDSTVLNSTRGVDEKFSGLFYLQGKEQVPAGQAKCGEIVATTKLRETFTGDTLCAKGSNIVFPPIVFPVPSISFAIQPETRADEDKISQAIQRIMEEDPTVKVEREPQTKELIISGNGQLHVEVITEKLKKRYKVNVILKPPKIPYKETIKGRADVQGKYKKQTGGRGQYGDVKIIMEPLPRGKDFEFEDKIFGGAIPKNFIPSVEKGIQEARQKGVLAGYPVVDFKVTLYDGSYHEVDSSDIAFKIAASMAFKKGMKQAKPTILEPIMNVYVYTPEAYMGDIMGNLNGRRGKVLGIDQKGNMRIIKAQVPMAEMLDFEPTLTSITGGRGSYYMEFSHYEEVPAHLQQKIIQEAIKEGRITPEEE